MLEELTVGDLRRMLRRIPDNTSLVVEVESDNRRVCFYGDVAFVIALAVVGGDDVADLL
jgi:hypothetical protein